MALERDARKCIDHFYRVRSWNSEMGMVETKSKMMVMC